MILADKEPATNEKAVELTIEVESGRVYVRPINGASFEDSGLTDAYGNFGAGYDTVLLVVRSRTSPGCLRLIGGTIKKVC